MTKAVGSSCGQAADSAAALGAAADAGSGCVDAQTAGTIPESTESHGAGAPAAGDAGTPEKRFKQADIFKFVGLLAFLAIMGVIIWFMWPLFSDVFEEGGVAAVVARVREAGVGGFFVLEGLQFLQIVVAFIPGEVVQIAAGMIYGPWLGALAVLLGCVVTSALIFLLVHKLGAPFVQDMVPTSFLEKFRAFEASGKLDIVVFVLFLIPGLPKDTFTYLVPLTNMPLGRFLLLANVGRIPGVVISTFAAGSLAQGDYLQAGIIFAVTAAVAIAGLLNKDRIIALFERGHERTRTRR